MADLSWHDFYEIGIGFIDEDHRNMLAVMRRVSGVLGGREMAECRVILGELIGLVQDHFSREEQFLALAGYPEFEDHCRYHQQLMERAQDMILLCETASHQRDLDACFDGMARLFIDDVLRGDVRFKSYMEYEGIIQRKI